ncbi:MAG: helix-turn-helix transcriptional regulator [Acidobacteria bacterium]|nr:helix-turn-helix transcriptional regulator [Acidobacteriota bacterium]
MAAGFGKRLKLLRKGRHWRQKELAKHLSVSLPQLNKYESGYLVAPAEKLVLIADLFGTTVDYLLHGITHNDELVDQALKARLIELQNLDTEDKAVVLRLMDAFVSQAKSEKSGLRR